MPQIAVNLEIKLKEGRKVKTYKIKHKYTPLELPASKHIKYVMADIIEKLADS